MMTNNEGIHHPDQTSTTSASEQQSPSFLPHSTGRFPQWIALTVLSLVAWLATIGGVKRHQMDRPEKWALAATTLSVVFATMGVLCYLFERGVFMGELPEAVLVSHVVFCFA